MTDRVSAAAWIVRGGGVELPFIRRDRKACVMVDLTGALCPMGRLLLVGAKVARAENSSLPRPRRQGVADRAMRSLRTTPSRWPDDGPHSRADAGVAFGPLRLLVERHELCKAFGRDGALCCRAGAPPRHLVTKDELMTEVWRRHRRRTPAVLSRPCEKPGQTEDGKKITDRGGPRRRFVAPTGMTDSTGIPTAPTQPPRHNPGIATLPRSPA